MYESFVKTIISGPSMPFYPNLIPIIYIQDFIQMNRYAKKVPILQGFGENPIAQSVSGNTLKILN